MLELAQRTYRYQITPKDHIRASRFAFSPSWQKFLGGQVSIWLIFGFIMAHSFETLLLLLSVGLFSAWLFYGFIPWCVRWKHRTNQIVQSVLIWDEQKISISNNINLTEYRWSEVSRWRENSKYIVLILPKTSYLVVPKHEHNHFNFVAFFNQFIEKTNSPIQP